MLQTWLLLVLAAAYGLTLAQATRTDRSTARADLLSPQGRAVERAMAEGRHHEALSLAQGLHGSFPRDPFVVYLLATIHHELEQPAGETAAWEHYMGMSETPAEACPAVGLAYERLGDRDRALERFRQCVALEPGEPDRIADLAEAYERAGQLDAARDAFRQAAALDSRNPHLTAKVTANSPSEGDR